MLTTRPCLLLTKERAHARVEAVPVACCVRHCITSASFSRTILQFTSTHAPMLVSHPPAASNMSSKRIPLANNPNAANSPFRSVAAKRSRAQVEGKEAEHILSPPKKKQLLGIEGNGIRRAQHISPDEREGRVFLGKAEGAATNAFARKLAAAREARHSQPRPADKEAKTLIADIDTINQWRKHYRKVFPTFVFYFESLPADVSAKSSKQIQSLGAVCSFPSCCTIVAKLIRMSLARRKVLFKSGYPHSHHTGYTSKP